MKHLLLTILALTSALLHAAEPAADPDAKLREALRATALQLRTAQGDLANAQATTAAAEQKTKTLEKQLADAGEKLITQTKRAGEAQTTADKTIATLGNKLAERDQRLADYGQALEKWKAAYQQAAATAQARDAEKTQLATQAARLKTTLADRERKNLVLFTTANEILDRYQNYALGKAIAAKEPFTQLARAKIETQVQGYQDKILDNRLSAKSPN
jgi:chromosome segregation ATPase